MPSNSRLERIPIIHQMKTMGKEGIKDSSWAMK